jgi:hypothetical protein
MLGLFAARQRTTTSSRPADANGFAVVDQTSAPAGLTIIEATPSPA